MSDIIANIAKLLGWVTWYYVTYQFSTVGGFAQGSISVPVNPWLRVSNIKDLEKVLYDIALQHGCTNKPNIISITRIGS